MRSDRNNHAVVTDPVTKQTRPAFPLAALLLPARGATSSWLTLPLILMVTGLFRWAIGIWGYSAYQFFTSSFSPVTIGFQKPPMYGDFEAQRHWIEITTHLPVSHWYFHDLEWWGLDYPPLTAYHSWIMGKIGQLIEPAWFALNSSRGLEGQSLKVYMRATVLVSDYLIYVPAVVFCSNNLGMLESVNSWEVSVALTAILMQPATMLIDHGHFQYNTVMLGFVVAAVTSCLRARPARACFWFVAALGYKQMALFYAPAVFAYLLGICIIPRIDVGRFIKIAAYTSASFAALFLPFVFGVLVNVYSGISLPVDTQAPPLLHSLPSFLTSKGLHQPLVTQLSQAIHRIFPFSRGLFEDKVANIWCAVHSSGLYKLNRADPAVMSSYALALTTISILPPCLVLFLRPRKEVLLWGLAVTAWGFFLCSYQVHEKNVLLPLLPMTLLLAGKGGLKSSMRAWIGFANILSCWTMFPLLERDDLVIPYMVMTLLWAWLLGLPPVSITAYSGVGGVSLLTTVLHLSMYAVMFGWHVAKATIAPPANMPDIMVVANVCVGTAGFGVCYLWCLSNLLLRSKLLPGRSGALKAKVL